MSRSAMICPNCQTELHEVKAETGLGYYLALDQCRGCGGIWCDRWEALPLTPAAAERLDHVDEAGRVLDVPTATPTPCCPRCRARLRPVSDRCCRPMRVSRGARTVKACGSTVVNCARSSGGPGTRRRHAAALEPLTQRVMDAGNAAPTVRRLADATEPAQEGETAAALVRETVGGLWWVVLRTALRLLLHI